MTDEQISTTELLNVCGYLLSHLDKGRWQPSTRLEDLVLRTLARSRTTYETILELSAAGRLLQAAMLGRSLFEDMVIVHWLILHEEDPDWLIDRFYRHADARRLNEAATRRAFGGDPIDVSDLAGQERALVAEFGKHAQRDWWGKDAAGSTLSMPMLVTRLASEPRFQPRLRGEAPILEHYYRLQQKAWTQTLHHTAMGMDVASDSSGAFPPAISRPSLYQVLAGNYWVFGQEIYAALELGSSPEAQEYFDRLFLAGLGVFAAAVDIEVPWRDRITTWAAEEPTPDPRMEGRED